MDNFKNIKDAYKQGRFDMQMDIYLKLIKLQEEINSPLLSDIISDIIELN
jgi:hypothetical protein